MERRFQRASAPAVSDTGKLTGRAIAYNQWTMIGNASRGGFREKVNPKALNKTITDGDMVLLDNHDPAKPLARTSAGTLTLRNTGDGLDWDASTPDTTYANDAVKNTKANNYGGCSFGFDIVRDKWSVGADGVEEREILEAKVPEISICTFPAYGQTSVSARDQFEAAMEARARFWEHELRDYTQKEVDALGAKGQAFKNPDGTYSYPVANATDLGNAIRAVGRGGASHNAIRKYIIGRAKALGLSAKIPDNWNADGSLSEANSAPEVTVSGTEYDDMAAELISKWNELPEDSRRQFLGSTEMRAAAASYSDLSTCGECGATGQYGRFCTDCGASMSQPAPANAFCPSCGAAAKNQAKQRDAADHEHRDTPSAKATDGQHQDHPPVVGTHTHASADSAHTHNSKNGFDHSPRSAPVTATHPDEWEKRSLRFRESTGAIASVTPEE